MGIKRKRKSLLKNLSVKWSLFLYMSVCVVVAVLFSMLLGNLFNGLQTNIVQTYEAQYQDELSKQGDIVVDGVIVQKNAIRFYTQNIEEKFSPMDKWLYQLYGGISSLIIFVVFPLCIVLTSVLFYRRKLKRPLAILDASSAKITGGDLDFQVAYDSGDEFGRLAASFETMRASLNQTNRDMWKTMEQRKHLNAAFAHDLRTPLTVLKGYCEFLIQFLPGGKLSTEKVLSTLSMMQQSIHRLEGYTKTMTSLQKLEEIEPAPAEVSFCALCKELRTVALSLAGDKQFAMECRGDGIITVDSAFVFQVCENLVANAARYGPGKVELFCCLSENLFTITVADDGPGFSPQALKRATEPYYREEKAKDPFAAEHFGMGLSICKLLCEAHGGAITLENKNGARVTASFAGLALKNNEIM